MYVILLFSLLVLGTTIAFLTAVLLASEAVCCVTVGLFFGSHLGVLFDLGLELLKYGVVLFPAVMLLGGCLYRQQTIKA